MDPTIELICEAVQLHIKSTGGTAAAARKAFIAANAYISGTDKQFQLQGCESNFMQGLGAFQVN